MVYRLKIIVRMEQCSGEGVGQNMEAWVHLSTQSHRQNGSAAHLSWAALKKGGCTYQLKFRMENQPTALESSHSSFSIYSTHSQLILIIQ